VEGTLPCSWPHNQRYQWCKFCRLLLHLLPKVHLQYRGILFPQKLRMVPEPKPNPRAGSQRANLWIQIISIFGCETSVSNRGCMQLNGQNLLFKMMMMKNYFYINKGSFCHHSKNSEMWSLVGCLKLKIIILVSGCLKPAIGNYSSKWRQSKKICFWYFLKKNFYNFISLFHILSTLFSFILMILSDDHEILNITPKYEEL